VVKRRLGFTIVELLIVIVVIATLAAVTIVAFRGAQDRAHNSRIVGDCHGCQNSNHNNHDEQLDDGKACVFLCPQLHTTILP
jgi:prepilin-type N-terminal cleavage/methylation domain-containing protein